MNLSLLEKEAQEFIDEHLMDNITPLLLKGTTIKGMSIQELVEQIEAKRKSKKKLPTFFNTSHIYFPNKRNVEQSSSEATANYKSKLISGKSIIDLTGGLGVDCLYFSYTFKYVIHCEQNSELSKIAQHNFNQLKIDNLKFVEGNGIEYLASSNQRFDYIYVDPSRRHDVKGKVFLLSDCEPNIPENLDELFERSDSILIKTSPLLDIKAGLRELQHVKEIHIIAINNEVKELLWLLDKNTSYSHSVKTVNIVNNSIEKFDFELDEEELAINQYSLPINYLYEPNASIMKSGGFKSISRQINIPKLHEHSHLYTSNNLVDFPGRSFKIEKLVAYQKKEIRKSIPLKANITTRNFPETVAQLRKKYKVSDGGDRYLFFTTNLNNEKIMIVCKKIGYKNNI